jgi:hypothetical protein
MHVLPRQDWMRLDWIGVEGQYMHALESPAGSREAIDADVSSGVLATVDNLLGWIHWAQTADAVSVCMHTMASLAMAHGQLYLFIIVFVL